ncbi:hypothetical protein JCM3774_005889 [Rhodotorula dairenensis]
MLGQRSTILQGENGLPESDHAAPPESLPRISRRRSRRRAAASASPWLSLATAVAVLASFDALATAAGAAIPPMGAAAARRAVPSPTDSDPLPSGWCRPQLSGLVQQIRKSGDVDIVWKAAGPSPAHLPGGSAAPVTGMTDGVRAVKFPRSMGPSLSDGDLDLAYEWFVEPTSEVGVYSIASAAAPAPCFFPGTDSPGLLNPDLDPLPPRCTPAHLFRLSCQSCDPHEDSASGCLIRSVLTRRCVELVSDPDPTTRPRLGWSDCEMSTANWSTNDDDASSSSRRKSGSRARRSKEKQAAMRRQRQLWDIAP